MIEFLIGLTFGLCLGYVLCGLLSVNEEEDTEKKEVEAFNRGYYEGKKTGFKKGYKACLDDEERMKNKSEDEP